MRIIVLVINCRGLRGASLSIFPQSQMGPFETIYIDETVAACNGGGGPLGHPRVYLNLGPAGKIECPYCSRLFVNRAMQSGDTSSAATPPKVSEERNA